MFRKILIANRGEIAVRVIRTCKELGVRTVAVYSPADANALHVELADESYTLSGIRGYLNIEEIITVAKRAQAEAVHPGYGFLAEDPDFVRACEANGLVFIGPSSRTVEMVGNKINARRAAVAAGVPVVPGSSGATSFSRDEMLRLAEELGYPVIVKAAGGGGGRGMRLARDAEELTESLVVASREAAVSFDDATVFLEKYLLSPRHVEVQILADQYGNVVHLGERDCSIQRRHQKLIEEAPCPVITDSVREVMGATAVRVARAVGYVGAGTVECLMNPDGTYYFMEMNARIQVEHPVTEMITGLDIVKEQLRVASGEPLGYDQSDISLKGWAIECRLNAEDPYRNFLPAPGTITKYHQPGGPGVRIDCAAYAGCAISPHYDSMFGKLISWGRNRGEAIQRMRRALDEIVVEGIKTTLPFHRWALNHPFFCRGEVSTSFLDQHWPNGTIEKSA